ncbi:MAG: 50S ribosomal protein L4 [Minisyncoccia bacterium]
MATKTTTKTKKEAPAKRVRAAKAASVEKTLPIFSMDGAQKGTIALPANLFDVQWNADLVHQVVVGMQANARPITAHTKNRGEVRGGGKKPWKQKGTGRARHGSSRSPIWKGGGVTHGPRAERIFAVKINKKMRLAALLSVLTRKAKDGEIIFIEKMVFSAPKTKDAKNALVAIAKAADAKALVAKKKNAALFAFSESSEATKKSFRNIGNVDLEEVRNLNPVDLMTHRYLVIEDPAKAFETLSARIGK